MAEEERKPNRLLEAASKAMFTAQLSSEVSRTSDFSIDCSKFRSFERTGRTNDVFKLTISGWALTSYYLRAALEAQTQFDSRSQQQEFFGPMGPLGTDSGRIRLARSFDWIPKEQQLLLDKLRKKRNLIAHEVSDGSAIDLKEIFSCTYSDQLKSRIDKVLKAYSDAALDDGQTFNRTSDFFVSAMFVLLAFDTFEWIYWGRSRDRLRLLEARTPISFPDGTEPMWHRNLVASMVTTVLNLNSVTPIAED